MADFSNTRINMALFQQLEKIASQTKRLMPLATGDQRRRSERVLLLALALEPVENWKGEPSSSFAAASGTGDQGRKPWESISVSPERGAEFKEENLATPHTAAQPVAAGVSDDEELDVSPQALCRCGDCKPFGSLTSKPNACSWGVPNATKERKALRQRCALFTHPNGYQPLLDCAEEDSRVDTATNEP